MSTKNSQGYNSGMNIFQIKEGKVEVLRSWFRELETTLRAEARETIRHEQAVHEFGGIFRIGDVWYGCIYMAAYDEILPSDRTQEINKKHRVVMRECFERRVAHMEPVYDIRVDEEGVS